VPTFEATCQPGASSPMVASVTFVMPSGSTSCVLPTGATRHGVVARRIHLHDRHPDEHLALVTLDAGHRSSSGAFGKVADSGPRLQP